MNKPDFLIIGAIKGATTSIYDALLKHPKIDGPTIKEINYFSNEKKFKLGLDWYFSQFPERADGGLLCEATPNYASSTKYLLRIKNQLGKVKIIYNIRNPVERFISQYLHFRAMNEIFNDPDKKQDILSKHSWAARVFDNPDVKWRGESNLFSDIVLNKNSAYYSNGEYIVKIKIIQDLFGKDNLHIVEFSDLVNDPNLEISKILTFLNLDINYLTFGRLNDRSFWSTYYDASSEIDDQSVNIIKNHYKPYNEMLENYLERNLNWNS